MRKWERFGFEKRGWEEICFCFYLFEKFLSKREEIGISVFNIMWEKSNWMEVLEKRILI